MPAVTPSSIRLCVLLLSDIPHGLSVLCISLPYPVHLSVHAARLIVYFFQIEMSFNWRLIDSSLSKSPMIFPINFPIHAILGLFALDAGVVLLSTAWPGSSVFGVKSADVTSSASMSA